MREVEIMKLEPCKCRNNPVLISINKPARPRPVFYLFCENCGIGTVLRYTKKDAIENWNNNMKLKPCFKCGSNDVRINHPFVSYYSECNICHQYGKESKSLDKAIDNWNRKYSKLSYRNG